MPKAPEPAAVRRAILRWYARNGRAFPWRATREPYRVLVSEIMLQQTQADRVAARFQSFLDEFPDARSLARARRADVLRAWRGMGYNNRAVRLHDAVKEVVASYGGRLPRDPGTLESLPGIGKYTAHAVACFAHGQRVPVVDVNIRRVLSRIFHRMSTISSAVAEHDAWDLAQDLLPANAYDWHQALMDFGSMVCSARSPKCDACPVAGRCLSAGRFNGVTSDNPGRKREPSHLGVARRFWRGSLVDVLRESQGPRTIGELRRRVRPRGSRPAGATPSAGWITDIVSRLEKDGVIEVRRSGRRVEVALAS